MLTWEPLRRSADTLDVAIKALRWFAPLIKQCLKQTSGTSENRDVTFFLAREVLSFHMLHEASSTATYNFAYKAFDIMPVTCFCELNAFLVVIAANIMKPLTQQRTLGESGSWEVKNWRTWVH